MLLTIPFDQPTELSACWHLPDITPPTGLTALILAHGAGGDMNSEFVVTTANGLSAAGIAVLRFNFPYRETGRKAPDTPKRLEAAWQAAIQHGLRALPTAPKRVILAGKSMGGRLAAHLLAQGQLQADGLILYGYPLHAPGKTDKLRTAPLLGLQLPTLLISGSRDRLCDLDLLRNTLAGAQCSWQLDVIEGGDHSFKVPKAMHRSLDDIHAWIIQRSLDWLETL